MTSCGRESLRVVAVTRDARFLDSLRRDGRMTVVAQLEDGGLARALVAAAAVDAVVVDEREAAAFMLAWESPPGLKPPEVYVLGLPSAAGGASTGPEAPGPRPPGAEALGPELPGPEALRPQVPGPQTLRPEAPRPDPSTLREWWLSSRGRTPAWSPASSASPATSMFGTASTFPTASASPAGPPRPGPGPEVLMRQTIVVISPKGGVGKTFISVNLAVSLARYTGFRVLLLDLDLSSGDAAVHLDLLGSPTLAELVPYAANLEPAHLERVVVTHAPSRLEAVLAPARPEAGDLLSGEHLANLLRLAGQRYDFVIVDTPPDPSNPLVRDSLKEATTALVVSSLDAASLRQCRLLLDSLGPSGAAGRVDVVLNQVHERAAVPAARAASFLGTGPGNRAFSVPEDRPAVERSVFEGRPLALSGPDHPVARAVYELAHSFCPVFGEMVAGPARRSTGLRGLLEAVRRW